MEGDRHYENMVLGGQIGWRVLGQAGCSTCSRTILELLSAGDISRRRAAKELEAGYATLKRLLDGKAAVFDGRRA